MKARNLSNKEIKELNKAIERFNFSFDKRERVEISETEEYKLIKADNQTLFFYLRDEIIPALKLLLSGKCTLKKISVDMGAVKFIVNGADIMKPGIREIEPGIEKNEIITVIDI
jgi:predicted ribosome-associated RNA-binding protein Tma20